MCDLCQVLLRALLSLNRHWTPPRIVPGGANLAFHTTSLGDKDPPQLRTRKEIPGQMVGKIHYAMGGGPWANESRHIISK